MRCSMAQDKRQFSSLRSPWSSTSCAEPGAFFYGQRWRKPGRAEPYRVRGAVCWGILPVGRFSSHSKTILQKVTGYAVYPVAMIARAAKKSIWWIEGWNRAESTTKSRMMLQSGSPSTYLPKIKSSVVNVLPFDEPRLAKINC